MEDNRLKQVVLTNYNFSDEERDIIIGMVEQWLSMYPGKVKDYDIDIKIKVNNIEWEEEK